MEATQTMTELRNNIALWCKLDNMGQQDAWRYEANIYEADGDTLIRKIEVQHDEFELISILGEGPFKFDFSLKPDVIDSDYEEEEDLIEF